MRILGFIIVNAILAVTPADAQNLYKYRNDKGEWVYTDRKPAANQEFETGALPADTTGPAVRVDRRDNSEGSVLVITNEFFGPVEVGILLTELNNIPGDIEKKRRYLLPPRSEVTLTDIKPSDPGRSWGFKHYFYGALGDPSAEHRPEQLYRIPFSRSTTYRVAQAYPGHYSHKDASSQYAIDFDMPVGTQIYAARGGTVIDMATHFFTSGTDLKKDGQRANHIRILHDDGTMAIYAHLQWDSIRVRPGNRVERGQYIANSGNTGFSTGPHLHFDVQRNSGLRLVSIPVRFEGAGGAAITPKEGDRLTAY